MVVVALTCVITIRRLGSVITITWSNILVPYRYPPSPCRWFRRILTLAHRATRTLFFPRFLLFGGLLTTLPPPINMYHHLIPPRVSARPGALTPSRILPQAHFFPRTIIVSLPCSPPKCWTQSNLNQSLRHPLINLTRSRSHYKMLNSRPMPEDGTHSSDAAGRTAGFGSLPTRKRSKTT